MERNIFFASLSPLKYAPVTVCGNCRFVACQKEKTVDINRAENLVKIPLHYFLVSITQWIRLKMGSWNSRGGWKIS